MALIANANAHLRNKKPGDKLSMYWYALSTKKNEVFDPKKSYWYQAVMLTPMTMTKVTMRYSDKSEEVEVGISRAHHRA